MLKVGLVAHHEHGELVPVLDAQDLLVELEQLLEAGVVGHREHQQEALARAHVLLSHRAELLLPRSVQDWGTNVQMQYLQGYG